jgi:hypothetical protein
MADPAITRFNITWDRGAYYVDVPRYEGGAVVPADIVDALLDALKPFAQLADICDHFNHPNERRICHARISGYPTSAPTAGDCRAARAAIAKAGAA